MSHRSSFVTSIFCLLAVIGCGDKSAPPVQSVQDTQAITSAPAPTNDPNITRAKLNAHGVPSEYAAEFVDEKLVKINEQRQSVASQALVGEYTFQGGRLLSYRGAKAQQPAALDLQFDLQGTLLSGRGPDVTDEDIATIRDRAQLLRSHALAQRAARGHSDGH